jgi:hypothetical protein
VRVTIHLQAHVPNECPSKSPSRNGILSVTGHGMPETMYVAFVATHLMDALPMANTQETTAQWCGVFVDMLCICSALPNG